MNFDQHPPYSAQAFDAFLKELEAIAKQSEAEAKHREIPGVNDPAAIVLYCASSIGGGPDLTIVYTDSDGVTSVRHIRVNSIERCLNGHTIIRVYDLDRKAPRSFRLDRIQAAATEYRTVGKVAWA